jgi:hypothetical protein
MKSLALLVLLTGVAGASERYPIFPDRHVPEELAVRRVHAVVDSCAFSEMARIGPDPVQAARCNAAEGKLIELGQRAIPAVMQRLDGESFHYGAETRLFDVLVRVGGTAMVQPLVEALERVDAHAGDMQMGEHGQLLRALARLTRVYGSSAAEYRAWLETHRPTQTAKADPILKS